MSSSSVPLRQITRTNLGDSAGIEQMMGFKGTRCHMKRTRFLKSLREGLPQISTFDAIRKNLIINYIVYICRIAWAS
jgi:hypothetical protein